MKDHGKMKKFVKTLGLRGNRLFHLMWWRKKINIVGIRDSADQEKDIFNDRILLITGNNVVSFVGTTDPGKYWTGNAKRRWGVSGVAHLVEGWYPETYQIGDHMGKKALVQVGGPVKVWRDVNKNYKYDDGIDDIQTGYFGINIHYTKNGPVLIGRWSGGCQVIQDSEDWNYFFKACKDSKIKAFNYLLINKNELDEKYKKEFFD